MPNQLTVLVIGVTCQTSFLGASACPVPCSVPPPPWTAESTQGDSVLSRTDRRQGDSVLGRTDRRQGDGVYWAGLIEDRALLLCTAGNWEKCIPALIHTLMQFHLFSFVLVSCTSLCNFCQNVCILYFPVHVFPVRLYPALRCVHVSSTFVSYTSLCTCFQYVCILHFAVYIFPVRLYPALRCVHVSSMFVS